MSARTPFRGAPVQGVAIDLDGTLLDTLPDLSAAVRHMLIDLGLPAVAQDALRRFIGRGVHHLVRSCLEASMGGTAEEAAIGKALRHFEGHYARCNGTQAKLYPQAREGLESMAASGFRLACVTNKASRFTLPLLEAAGVARLFDAIVTPETTGRTKPDPSPIRAALEVLGIAAANAVAVGDSAIDGQAARAAGCRFLLVPYGYADATARSAIDCDGIVASLREAADLFRAVPRANS